MWKDPLATIDGGEAFWPPPQTAARPFGCFSAEGGQRGLSFIDHQPELNWFQALGLPVPSLGGMLVTLGARGRAREAGPSLVLAWS